VKPTDRPHLTVGALSHPGERREHNEDRYSVTAYQLERTDQPALVAVVADGIGGHQAGEVAAELTVDRVVERVGGSTGQDPLATLRAAVSDAARAVIEAAGDDEARQGMGSTVAAVWVIGNRLYLTNVGDSRIYLLQGDQLRQLTNDHTWVQEALDHAIISEEEAEDHPHQHVLRRHIGGEQPPEADLRIRLTADPNDHGSTSHQGLTLQAADKLLLCSDGLTDLVEAPDLSRILGSMEPAAAAEALVDLARERGGHDNITVVVLELPAEAAGQPKRRRFGLFGLLLVGLLGAVLAVVLAWRLELWPYRTVDRPDASANDPVPTQTAPPLNDPEGILPPGAATPTP
jgi:protein phosphatase